MCPHLPLLLSLHTAQRAVQVAKRRTTGSEHLRQLPLVVATARRQQQQWPRLAGRPTAHSPHGSGRRSASCRARAAVGSLEREGLDLGASVQQGRPHRAAPSRHRRRRRSAPTRSSGFSRGACSVGTAPHAACTTPGSTMHPVECCSLRACAVSWRQATAGTWSAAWRRAQTACPAATCTPWRSLRSSRSAPRGCVPPPCGSSLNTTNHART